MSLPRKRKGAQGRIIVGPSELTAKWLLDDRPLTGVCKQAFLFESTGGDGIWPGTGPPLCPSIPPYAPPLKRRFSKNFSYGAKGWERQTQNSFSVLPLGEGGPAGDPRTLSPTKGGAT